MLVSILNGSNEETVLDELRESIQDPRNADELSFVTCWDVTGFLASDGFEWLSQQAVSAEELASDFERVGLPEMRGYLDRAAQIERGTNGVTDRHEQLRELLDEYLETFEPRLLSAFGDFVRRHEQSFRSA